MEKLKMMDSNHEKTNPKERRKHSHSFKPHFHKPNLLKKFEKPSKDSSFEIQILANANNSIFIKKNKILACGSNDNSQCNSSYNSYVSSPQLLNLPNNEHIYCINFGLNFVVCSTEKGHSYSWGSNSSGQLGGYHAPLSSPFATISFPNNQKISLISCGCKHSIIISNHKNCYVWGANSCGQLGLGDIHKRLSPTLLTLPNNEKPCFVICSPTNNSSCLSEEGNCYVWGYNLNGELGLGDTNNHLTPTLLTLPNNERISFITCGSLHTICLTENKLCYVWGYNGHGELGLGDTINRSTPALFSLPNNESIYFITCGSYHTMCLTENNLCYVWGYNRYGELGLGDKNNRSSPTLFSLPNNEKISFITCGFNHTICITSKKKCYVWGRNNFGQLGLGDRKNKYSPVVLKLKHF